MEQHTKVYGNTTCHQGKGSLYIPMETAIQESGLMEKQKGMASWLKKIISTKDIGFVTKKVAKANR